MHPSTYYSLRKAGLGMIRANDPNARRFDTELGQFTSVNITTLSPPVASERLWVSDFNITRFVLFHHGSDCVPE